MGQSKLRNEEIRQLQCENRELFQAHDRLQRRYYNDLSSALPSTSPQESYSQNCTAFPPAATLNDPMPTTSNASNFSTHLNVAGPHSRPTHASQTWIVISPCNIEEIRRSLNILFAPILNVVAMSNPQYHLTTLAAMTETLPPQLQPTMLQLQTPHSVYIDMIPSATLRDKLIAVGPAFSGAFLAQACTVTCEIEDVHQLKVWGKDWLNEFSWEFSSTIIERFSGWLLTGEWTQRANFWRRARGAPLIPAGVDRDWEGGL